MFSGLPDESDFPKDLGSALPTLPHLRETPGQLRARYVACPCPPKDGDDDEFDAAVGYLLGVLYLRDLMEPRPSAIALGNRETGSFLVPNVDGLTTRWDEFVEKWPKVGNR